jgi:hypothetical protein
MFLPPRARHYPDAEPLPLTVRCAECEAAADEKARGWRALIGEEDDSSLMVAIFCPACAEREFGYERRATGGDAV